MIELLIFVGLVICLVQIIRLIFSDCDLHLQWYCKFGRKLGKPSFCQDTHTMIQKLWSDA